MSWEPFWKLLLWTFLEFWSGYGERFPFLRKVARAVFVVPGTSASAERAWSLADDISGGDRASIAPEALNRGVFLKKKRKGVGQNPRLLLL